jgi:RND family efflux transporter MFP subunit
VGQIENQCLNLTRSLCYPIIVPGLRKLGAKRGWLVAGCGIVLAALLMLGWLRRDHRRKVVQAAALSIVNVAKARRSDTVVAPLLEGTLAPLTEAFVYAHSGGYVTKSYHDAGDRVSKGELLAEIELPQNDREMGQSRAALTQAEHEAARAKEELDNARAQEERARAVWERYKTLFQHGAVARQEVDQMSASLRGAVASTSAARSNLAAAEQNLEANRTNLNRLTAREQVEYIRAPFSGAVTARSCAKGTAVDGESALFRMAEIGTLRIVVDAPPDSLPPIRTGQRVTVSVPEIPGAMFPGKVVGASPFRLEGLRVEVEVPNPDRKLLPGMHAQVRGAGQ